MSDRFATITDQQIRDIMDCGDTSTARIKICRLIYDRTKPDKSSLGKDVINLVIAAREALEFTFGLDGEELRALDRAVEAFAARVPYDEDPYDPIFMFSSARKAKGWEE